MKEACDIAIVGAGAAGLAAAIFAGETARKSDPEGRRIVVLESASTVGAKILISGGGRCNVTNAEVSPRDFNGARNPIRNILAAFDQAAALRWFESMGVALKREENGKLFPVTNRARSVLDALLGGCAQRGITIRTGCRVTEVVTKTAVDAETSNGGFVVYHAQGRLDAGCVIMATGGRSLPRTGSDGNGWEIARQLGHDVTATHQALVPLKLESPFHAALSGIAVIVELSVVVDGRLADRRRGSMLWTQFGISGPVVMDASRHWIAARARSDRAGVRMICNFYPGETRESAEAAFLRAAAAHPRMSLSNLLAARMPERLAAALVNFCGIDPAINAGQLPRELRRVLISTLTAFELPLIGERGWDFAEVTAGGVPLDQIDYRTMESRRKPGLYLIGEMLDCDGRIGGFNFQWAWATGYLAGRAAAHSKRCCL
ncbi:MAG: NAD(P)/FAD-dependent oxidoreductase [Candidatus Binataceae bacterium]|nr:NAD(P)/FAD-dependent oxidoreductase [Candidatus Binataceae bacterium]